MKYAIRESEHQTCLECGSEVYGRTDKKFCCDSCRNRHNNRLRSLGRSITERTIRALNRNHSILEKLLEMNLSSMDTDRLTENGFRPEYMTGLRKTRAGHMECRCFDIKYCRTDRKIFNISRIGREEFRE